MSTDRPSSIYIYDYCEGYVIDASTGEVVDRIFDYSPQGYVSEGESVNRFVRRSCLGRRSVKLRLYRKAKRFEERGFVVDYSRLFSSGFKRSVLHEKSVKAEVFFNHTGLLGELEEVLREVGEKAPQLLTRSRRSQLVLAYVIRELKAGRKPRYRDVKGLVGDTTFRKILMVAQKYLERNGGLVNRVFENTTSMGRGVELEALTPS